MEITEARNTLACYIIAEGLNDLVVDGAALTDVFVDLGISEDDWKHVLAEVLVSAIQVRPLEEDIIKAILVIKGEHEVED